jgi:solute carrier family 25 uncoupling protein 27
MLAGSSAGIIGQAVASPTDLVKVQMQADGKRVAAGHQRRYKGIADAFLTIARQGGVSGLW